MRKAFIVDGTVTVIEERDVSRFYTPEIAERFKDCPEWVEEGDSYRDGVFEKKAIPPEKQREQAYEALLYKTDGTPLISWQERIITVDQANKVFLEYAAESNDRSSEIQALIIAAKAYIRELFPDGGEA